MTIAGRYRIERLLARGGMGTTYIAVDERAFERRVVIKVPDALRSDDARARFVNEARQIIGLQHPHIVTALDVGTVDNDDTTPFITMAYMGGGDLGERIAASGGVQSPDEVASWLVDIAGALDFVHEHHVLHRDVKPGNILFDRPGPNAEPFLADFGIAKALEGEMMVHTHTGEHLGSPKYMPPETWFGTPGPPFDQYSLACVAYEALSGTLPHTAANALALAMEKNAKPARPLTAVAPHVPAAAAAILGGVSLSGGQGRPLGIAIGVLSFSVLRSGMNAIGAPSYVNDIEIGIALLIVAFLDGPLLTRRVQYIRARAKEFLQR